MKIEYYIYNDNCFLTDGRNYLLNYFKRVKIVIDLIRIESFYNLNPLHDELQIIYANIRVWDTGLK